MKDLDDEDVARIAHLAMLRLNSADVSTMRSELNKILHAFEALDKLAPPGALEHDQRSGLVLEDVLKSGEEASRMRPDIPAERCCDPGDLVGVFPRVEDNLLVVPLVIEREDA